MVLTKTAMNELRTHLSFTQLRFHSSKNNGRTFHVTTVANNNGEAVVQYLSGQRNGKPSSCGSYVRMENDNSYLAGDCKRWKNEKWGTGVDQEESRPYRKVIVYLNPARRWQLYPPSKFECDDNLIGVTAGDFWKIYVR